MIIRDCKELPNGVLATFIIQISTSEKVVSKNVDFAVLPSMDAAFYWLDKELKKWMKTTLERFCNHREHALEPTPAVVNALYKIRARINKYSHLTPLCTAIQMSSEEFNVLLPGEKSKFRSWRATIQFIQDIADRIIKQQYQNNEANTTTEAVVGA